MHDVALGRAGQGEPKHKHKRIALESHLVLVCAFCISPWGA